MARPHLLGGALGVHRRRRLVRGHLLARELAALDRLHLARRRRRLLLRQPHAGLRGARGQ